MRKILTLTIMVCAAAFSYINVNAQCGTTVNTGVCYVNSTFNVIAVDICPADPAEMVTISFTAGSAEGCCDEVIIYSGTTGSGTGGTQIYNQAQASGSLAGLVVEGPTAGECLSVYIDADGSVDCTTEGAVPASFDVTCVPPPAAPSDMCNAPNPLCSGAGDLYSANTTGTAEAGNNYGCLSTQPRPSWFFLEVETSGDFNFSLNNTVDLDYAVWGPFASLAAATGTCGSLGAPSDCSYTGGTVVETPSITGATAGEIYVLLVTAYSATPTTFSVTNEAGTTGTTDCTILAPSACDASYAYSAVDVCSGVAPTFIEDSGACVEPAGNPTTPHLDLDWYMYAPGGVPGIAPGAYDPMNGLTFDNTFPITNPDLVGGADGIGGTWNGFICANLTVSAALTVTNNTCAPITVTYYAMAWDRLFDTGGDGTFGEYNTAEATACVNLRFDVVVWPAPLTVAVTDDGSTCGTPTVELRDAAGTVCETLTGACTVDGDAFNYDFSSTATAIALAAAPAGCVLPTLTGTITCGGCCTPNSGAISVPSP